MTHVHKWLVVCDATGYSPLSTTCTLLWVIPANYNEKCFSSLQAFLLQRTVHFNV